MENSGLRDAPGHQDVSESTQRAGRLEMKSVGIMIEFIIESLHIWRGKISGKISLPFVATFSWSWNHVETMQTLSRHL